jgi:hypothetical protein
MFLFVSLIYVFSFSCVFLVFPSIFVFAVPLSVFSSFLLLPVVRLFTGGGRDIGEKLVIGERTQNDHYLAMCV